MLERVEGGARTSQFSSTQSANPDGYNSWKYRTTETLPDGAQNVVYSNHAGQTMLTLFKLTGFEPPPADFDKVLAETRKTYPPPASAK